MREYYVYAYLDPRKMGTYSYEGIEFGYEPFYIGKGKGNRYINGIKDKKKCLKVSKIKSIINDGHFPVIVKIIDVLSENDAFEKEIELIKKIGRIDKKTGPLTNMTEGGDGTSGKLDTENDTERRKRFRHTEEWKSVLSKPVLQFKDGVLINEYNSVKDAAEKNGLFKQNISSCVKGKYKTTGGFVWKYKDQKSELQGHIKKENIMPKHTDATKEKMRASAKRGDDHYQKKLMGKNSKFSKKVIQKDMDGNIIKIWDSLGDITRELKFNRSNISRCCKGEVKRIGGFKWEFLI